jgi:hypothetical protein
MPRYRAGLIRWIGWGDGLFVRVLVVTLLVWVLFRVGGDMGVLFGEDADDVGSNFVVNYRLVVFAYDVDTAFLG